MTKKKFIEILESNDFIVHLVKENGKQCAELETWTDGGVNMIVWLNPFTPKEFASFVDDFNIDDQIDMYRKDDKYRNAFSVRQSLADFESFENKLKNIASLCSPPLS